MIDNIIIYLFLLLFHFNIWKDTVIIDIFFVNLLLNNPAAFFSLQGNIAQLYYHCIQNMTHKSESLSFLIGIQNLGFIQ